MSESYLVPLFFSRPLLFEVAFWSLVVRARRARHYRRPIRSPYSLAGYVISLVPGISCAMLGATSGSEAAHRTQPHVVCPYLVMALSAVVLHQLAILLLAYVCLEPDMHGDVSWAITPEGLIQAARSLSDRPPDAVRRTCSFIFDRIVRTPSGNLPISALGFVLEKLGIAFGFGATCVGHESRDEIAKQPHHAAPHRLRQRRRFWT